MNSFNYSILRVVLNILLSGIFLQTNQAQIEIQRAITYEQITDFETAYSISDMKISGDGSNIIFSTSGAEVKVYTIGVNGNNLIEVYDFERTGFGATVDISGDGNTIIWCDGFGEIFIANVDGSGREEIASLLPNPNTDFEDIEPTFPVPPRINGLGTEVFFMTAERDPRASGLWKVNANGSGLKQVFNYLDVASDVFGTDGSEYNFNTAFTDGFDISANGAFAIFGTTTFQLQKGEMEKGDAIVYSAGEFYNISTYATGYQPFATYVDGDSYMLFRREDNAETGAEEINLYALHLAGGAEIKIIEGLGIFSYPQRVQMTSSGVQGIVIAGGGLPNTPPITFVSSHPNYFIDLVNIDDVSIAINGTRMSSAYLPSINLDGDIFCFLAPTYPTQIWIGRIRASAVHEDPSIANVLIDPTEVLFDGSSSTTIEAEVKTQQGSIQKVAISAFKDGAYQFRAFTSDWPALLSLVNDGTMGDKDDTDYFYTNNAIRTDLPSSPLGEYTIRIAAANTTLKEISAVDFRPLSIVEELTSPTSTLINHNAIDNIQISPNPFTKEVTIEYTLERNRLVKVEVYDVYGRLVKQLSSGYQNPGNHCLNWDGLDYSGCEVPNGMYFCMLIIDSKSHLINLVRY